jgi:tetratricopeptide (TPR) repeat protein
MFKWLDASEAAGVGTALADDFVLHSVSGRSGARNTGADARPEELRKFLQKFLQRVDREARPLQLNVFKRAKLANSFKWRLLEKGVEPSLVDELTGALVQRLTVGRPAAAQVQSEAAGTTRKLGAKGAQALHLQGAEHLNRGAYTEALACYQELLEFDPRDAYAHNGLGSALARLTRYREAEEHLRRALGIRESLPEAHFNLASVLVATGRYREAETPLRRALKLKGDFLEARISLGGTLVLLSRLPEARDSYEKALRLAPSNALALVGLGKLDALEGRFSEAETAFRRALEVEPRASYAWAALAGLRRMTPADGEWRKRAEELAAGGLEPYDEAVLRFALGKYYDDVGDFGRAFPSYQRANQLQKLAATPYRRETHVRYVDEWMRIYTKEALEAAREGASDSALPVFVIGMPRSGTTLVEQIIASHPAAYGAGELDFWTTLVHKREVSVRQAVPEGSARKRLAQEYLRVLAGHSADASRIVDKAPMNADYLGLLHAVLPKARVIHVQRNPIDTCLSCYFQQFSPVMNYTMDLSDLADYYREHARLMAHWRRTLPPGTMLEIHYEELVADQEASTRRILEFLALPWDERCLEFHKTARVVTTASAWQVRQKIYRSSAQRWRHYEKFIKPLLSLSEHAA